jgi:hypothetical protein
VKRDVSHTEISAAMDCQAKHAFGYTGHLTGGTTLRPRAAHARLREGRAWGRAVAALHAVDDGGAVVPAANLIADSSPATLWPSDATAPGSHPGSGSPAYGRTSIADSDTVHRAAIGSASGIPGGDPFSQGGVGRFDPGNVSPAPSQSLHRLARAHRALTAALDEDAQELRAAGVYSADDHADLAVYLANVLTHYASTSEPMDVTDPEVELQVPLPSRTGARASNRFVFQGFLDGLTVVDGLNYIVEFKLRGRLSTFEQAVRGRQYRRYVWAAQRALGVEVVGVILDERLNETPKPARWVKAKRKGEGIDGMTPSHAKDQLCTAESYLEACREADVDPVAETIVHLEQRRWQVRHVLHFRRHEIEEAGRELVSAAHLISQLDSGVLWPVRNESTLRCGGCAFRDVCPRPDDHELIDLNFERRVPKRDKELEAA